VRARQALDDRGRPLAPFQRTIEDWQRMNAPAELYIERLAAAAELREHGSILQPGEPGYPGPSRFLARRWWRQARPAFLAARGELTPHEARLLARPDAQGQSRRWSP
jgi:hypothetical protein